MCEDYFLYYEEIDWAIRAKDKFKMSYAPDSHVYHKVGGASRKKSSRNSLKYLYKNRLVFTSKFYPEFLLKTKMSMIFQLFNNMRHKNWDDVSAIYYALKQSI
jgi:GT2 family glycosyltransferase